MTTDRDLVANPIFPVAARVTIVQMISDKRFFGVAMRGARYVCQLPLGYDGRTSVRWVNGFIVVAHPDLSPLLADTSTGKVKALDPHAFEQMKIDVRRQLNLSQRTRLIH